jgi:uncharacterized damage-inducible protein DinB
MPSQTNSHLQLAPPGAGLPAAELAVARMLFFFLPRAMSREAAADRFHVEAERVLKMVQRLDPGQAQRPVLIRRVMGIEDSSRNWSALMTLDHLVIVNPMIASIIEHLVAEKSFGPKLSTAAVKPSPKQTPDTIEKFRQATADYLERIQRLSSLQSQARHAHPWFGPLNAHQWHCLAAIHQTIHRRQLEAIMRRLNPREPT